MRDQLKADINSAMKAKENDRTTTLRGIWAEAQSIALNDKRKEISNADVILAAKKAVKEGNEGMEIFRVVNSPIANENFARNYRLVELATKYLPKNLSDEELNKAIDEIISDLTKQEVTIGRQSMGVIMKNMKDKYPDGNYDGKRLSALVKEKLENGSN